MKSVNAISSVLSKTSHPNWPQNLRCECTSCLALQLEVYSIETPSVRSSMLRFWEQPCRLRNFRNDLIRCLIGWLRNVSYVDLGLMNPMRCDARTVPSMKMKVGTIMFQFGSTLLKNQEVFHSVRNVNPVLRPPRMENHHSDSFPQPP